MCVVVMMIDDDDEKHHSPSYYTPPYIIPTPVLLASHIKILESTLLLFFILDYSLSIINYIHSFLPPRRLLLLRSPPPPPRRSYIQYFTHTNVLTCLVVPSKATCNENEALAEKY